MYGLGTDDSHHYHKFGPQFSNSGRGWVMVQSKSLDPADLILAMEAGQFYASSGVTFKQLTQNNSKIELEVAAAPGVQYTIEFIGAKKGAAQSEVFETVNGISASFNLTSEMLFVRAKITSTRVQENPFQEGDFESAWTQPISK